MLAEEARRSGDEHDALRGVHLHGSRQAVEHKAGRRRTNCQQRHIGDGFRDDRCNRQVREQQAEQNTRTVTCGAVMPAITARW